MQIDRLVQLETNVDDLDPRVLPRVIDRLLAAGALDAWITPIVMKKGRPAFTVSALVRPDAVDDVRTELFRETTTIGIRQFDVERVALDREITTIEVDGHPIGVKVSSLPTGVSNVSVEWDDVERVADATGRPAADVLADAEAAARRVASD